MKVTVLGTGLVGRTLAGKLMELGHDVMIGTRDVEATLSRTEPDYSGTSFPEWHATHSEAEVDTFTAAGSHGEILFNATLGTGALEALRAVGDSNLGGKIVIDVSNPLDYSAGMPPTFTVSNDDSLGEEIQRAFPDAKVVKTLNTVTARLMVDPASIGAGDHDIFVSGNDEAAKREVTEILTTWFGWRNVVDLGDITTARGTEMYLALWLRVMFTTGSPMFNVKIVR